MDNTSRPPSELAAAMRAAYPPVPASTGPDDPGQAADTVPNYLSLAKPMRDPVPTLGNGSASDATSFAQPPPLPLYTVEQFCARNPAFSAPSVRNLIFKSKARDSSLGEIPGNGLVEAGAVVRLGRKVLLHEPNFLAWVMSMQEAL